MRAGDRLLRRHVPALRRYIAARGVAEIADLDDLMQETLLAVLRNRQQLTSRRAIRAYLFAAARAKVIDAARWRSRDNRKKASLVGAIVVADDGDPLVADETSTSMADILSSLPEVLAVPLASYFLDEHSATELASTLGLPLGTVRTRVRRALQLVRARVVPGEYKGGRRVAAALVDGVERWAARGSAR